MKFVLYWEVDVVSCEENVEMPLLKIVFLELKKYKESLKNDYKKLDG